MARVHRTDLTDKMKERLARCEKKYLEKNGGDDSTRLIDSWYGANEEEKTMLKELLKLDRKFYSSVANVKNKHYETQTLQKKKKKARKNPKDRLNV